jgi:hypothetical protein
MKIFAHFLSNSSTKKYLARLLVLLVLSSLLLSGCDAADWIGQLPGAPTASPDNEAASEPSPEPTVIPQPELTFKATMPADTPSDEIVFLSIVDEVTGLALNSDLYEMTFDEAASGMDKIVYSIKLPFPQDSVVKYRYERQAGEFRVLEHIADGSPVRYRMALTSNPIVIEDIVSRWTDTFFEEPTGRIIGNATNSVTGEPISDLLIAVGGAQTISAADGTFIIEGLPAGIHNLVGYAMDGTYQTFQQGAQIAIDSTTPTPISLTPAQFVPVTIQVTVPPGTPPLIPIRLAGNLKQLGNTFGNLSGGVSTLAVNMPQLEPLPDGKYTLTLSLPIGADIRYKYTFGDGFWNAEHTTEGDFALRQMVVKENPPIVEDAIESWFAGEPSYLQFEVTVPDNTPATDYVSIQFNPLFGWMPSIPMWSFGENRYAYLLFSPLNLPGGVSYRYCRSDQCGKADDIATPGENATGRPVDISSLPASTNDEVTAWVNLDADPATYPVLETAVAARPNFAAGLELVPAYHPTWQHIFPTSLEAMVNLEINWLMLSPTWTAVDNEPTSLQIIPGQDALAVDVQEQAQLAQDKGMQVALFPRVNYPDGAADWWNTPTHDFGWWVTWFDRYQSFLLHNAQLAAQSNAAALIIGGKGIDPALPGGVLPDGSPSGVPGDTAQRWRDMLAKVREVYSGPIYWALPFDSQTSQNLEAPTFIDATDGIYLLWSVPLTTDTGSDYAAREAEAARLLDTVIFPLQQQLQKPLTLGATIPSPELQTQFEDYSILLGAAAAREWISGFFSRGYYPPVILQDDSNSVHGKPAEAAIRHWYGAWSGATP